VGDAHVASVVLPVPCTAVAFGADFSDANLSDVLMVGAGAFNRSYVISTATRFVHQNQWQTPQWCWQLNSVSASQGTPISLKSRVYLLKDRNPV